MVHKVIECHTFAREDRPSIRVLAKTTWYDGLLRAWFLTSAGWRADVLYDVGNGVTCGDTVDPSHVKGAEPPHPA